MPVFRYSAIDPRGQLVRGTLSVQNVRDVEEWLDKNRMTPLNVEIGKEEGDRQGVFTRLNQRFSTVSLEDRILMCRQVATLFSAGIPVLRIFDTIAKQVKNPRLRSILQQVKEAVEAGDGLSEAFDRHRDVFDDLFINLVRVGEESGSLDQSFAYLARLFENEKEVKERIKAATRYPKIVITALFLAVSFLMTFVVPKFIKIFASSKVELPLPTRILVSVSHLFTEYFWFILAAVVLGVIAYRFSMRHYGPRRLRDVLLLRMPVFGELYLKIYLSRFCRVFSVLVRSGVDIIRTIDLARKALQNLVLEEAMKEVRELVRNGVGLDDAMAQHSHFTPLVLQMVSAGVESGQVDVLMDKVADYYEAETDYTIKNLSTFIEPILLAVLGCIVGFIALAIFLPMWSMMQVMKGG